MNLRVDNRSQLLKIKVNCVPSSNGAILTKIFSTHDNDLHKIRYLKIQVLKGGDCV